jgi:hypothetical protein
MNPELNLNVDGPDKVPGVLRAAADAYAASARLTAAWQHHRTPIIWATIAGELALAADRIENEIERHFSMPAARVHRSTKNLCTGRWSKPKPE